MQQLACCVIGNFYWVFYLALLSSAAMELSFNAAWMSPSAVGSFRSPPWLSATVLAVACCYVVLLVLLQMYITYPWRFVLGPNDEEGRRRRLTPVSWNMSCEPAKREGQRLGHTRRPHAATSHILYDIAHT